MIQVAKDGNLQAVQALLSGGADVNARDKNGLTALRMASQNGHTEVVKLLLEKGAEVNVKHTTSGVTALWILYRAKTRRKPIQQMPSEKILTLRQHKTIGAGSKPPLPSMKI